jgi:uncharacterized protein (DUF2164 family)
MISNKKNENIKPLFLSALLMFSQHANSADNFFSITKPEKSENIIQYGMETVVERALDSVCEITSIIATLAYHARLNNVPEDKVREYLMTNHTYILEQVPTGLSQENIEKYIGADYYNQAISSSPGTALEDMRKQEGYSMLNKLIYEEPTSKGVLDAISAIYKMPDYMQDLKSKVSDNTNHEQEYALFAKVMLPLIIRRQIATQCRAAIPEALTEIKK